MRQCTFQAFAEFQSVGQARQRIMVGQMRHAGPGMFLNRDIPEDVDIGRYVTKIHRASANLNSQGRAITATQMAFHRTGVLVIRQWHRSIQNQLVDRRIDQVFPTELKQFAEAGVHVLHDTAHDHGDAFKRSVRQSAHPEQFRLATCPQMLVQSSREKPDTNHQNHGEGDSDGQQFQRTIRIPKGADRPGSFRDKRHGAHCNEMQTDDAEGQQSRRTHHSAAAGKTRQDHGAASRKLHRQDDGGDHQTGIPLHRGPDLHGINAHEMHGRDTGSNHGSTRCRGEGIPAPDSQGPATADHKYGQSKGTDGSGEVVADLDRCLIGQHGHEMCPPHTHTGYESCHKQPHCPAAGRHVDGPTGCRNSSQRRNHAQKGGYGDQTQVMLDRETVENAIHSCPRRIRFGEHHDRKKQGLA